MANRIAATITSMSRTSAVRAARTAVTGAENGGRLAGMEAAQRKGIDVQKEWLATLDGRTRFDHRAMDGQVVPLDKKFPNGLMYPGDPNGRPELVYNCRCTMVSNIAGIDTTDAQRRARNAEGRNEVISNMTYSQWAGWKQEKQNAPVFRPTAAQAAAGVAGGAALRAAVAQSIGAYTPEEQEMLMAQLENAPQEVQDMFAAYGPELRESIEYNPYTGKKERRGAAYYAPEKGTVTLHPDEVIRGDNCHLQGQVHFHEYGHNIDNLMGEKASGIRGTNYSSYWRNADGKTFEDIINDDVMADIAKVYRENNRYGVNSWKGEIPYEKEVKKVLNEYRKQNGSTKEYKALLKEYNKTKKDLEWYGDTSVDAMLSWGNFMDIHEDQLWIADAAAHGEKAVDLWIRTVRREGDEFANGDLSDMAAKTTIKLANTPYPLDVGHEVKYYKTYGNLGTEGFAELTSAFTSNPDSLDQIKKHLPNVYNAYLQMIKEGTAL